MYSAEHNASAPMSDPSHPLSRRIRVYQGIKTVERFFHFSELPSAPLLVDAVYLRGTQFNNIKDDPLNALFPKRSTMPGVERKVDSEPSEGDSLGNAQP